MPHELIYGKIVAGFRTLHISAVLESAADAKYYSDLIEDHVVTKNSFGQFFDDDSRDNSRFSLHNHSCNAASGCNCSFALLNCSEITALTETVQSGTADVSEKSL